MDLIGLAVRDPKGGGKGFKGGGSYGGGGGSGGNLPLWAELTIIFSVLLGTVGYAAWKAFKYLTLLALLIWAVRKVTERIQASRQGTKKVGGTFYRKVEKEERGVKDGNESVETISPHGPHAPPPSYSPLAG
ncbi:hypothetical protein Hte_003214 [Hypoxylon texense]